MKPRQPIHVLLVEDNPTDVLLAKEALAEQPHFEVVVAGRLSEALELLNARRFDVVLLDLGLPDSQGLEALRLHQSNPTVPVIVMTGRDDEELALQALHAGAQDYLVKSQLPDGLLGRSIRYAIERQRAEESQRERAELASLTADVGLALRRSTTLAGLFQDSVECISRNLGAALARIWTLDERSQVLELQASAGGAPELDGPHARVPVGKFLVGLVAEQRQAHLSNDVPNDPRFIAPEWGRREGVVAFAGYPLVVEDRLLGVMAVFAKRALSQNALAALEAVANPIAGGIVALTALAQVKQLSGLLPICSYCKKVRDDENYWQQVEAYVSAHSEARFSHGICPTCWHDVVQPEVTKAALQRATKPRPLGS